MKVNPFIFRGYDIRGIAGKDLNSDIVEAIGKAYGTFLRRRKIRHAVVGRDCRLSGVAYMNAMIKGMREMGINVIDLGMIMTQMMYYAQYRYQTKGGVIITASHNPVNYNGMKLATGYSQTTQMDEMREIKEIVLTDGYVKSNEKGEYEKKDVTEDYYYDLLKKVVLKRKFKIVMDACCGTTGKFLPEILKRAGCEVVGMNLEVDGSFPLGTPDPTEKKVVYRVAEKVLKEKADFGIAFDGDGDRIGVVDEKGNILWNDVLVAIFAKEILERFPKSKIVYNTLCSRVVRDVIRENGGMPVMWRTGHSFIKAKIAEEKAAFGGELSGHFFFADNAYGHDDGAYAALRTLEYLSEKGQSLGQLYSSFPKYISSPEIKIGCPDDKKVAVIKDLSKKFKDNFPDAEITDDTSIPGDDGIRADFNDGMMIFRYSQNGPYITIKFEALDSIKYEERKQYIRSLLESYPDMIWEDELCVNLESLE
ncbi:MAG: phosphomannomutase/phosphoglucomutase [bacterium]